MFILPLAPFLIDWRENYPFTVIEIKCWIDVDGRRGFEVVPMASINGNNFNWVTEPLRLDNRYRYVLEASEKFYGYDFLFWQSEKTGMIIPDRRLVLEPGFESDSWWQNYGRKRHDSQAKI